MRVLCAKNGDNSGSKVSCMSGSAQVWGFALQIYYCKVGNKHEYVLMYLSRFNNSFNCVSNFCCLTMKTQMLEHKCRWKKHWDRICHVQSFNVFGDMSCTLTWNDTFTASTMEWIVNLPAQKQPHRGRYCIREQVRDSQWVQQQCWPWCFRRDWMWPQHRTVVAC